MDCPLCRWAHPPPHCHGSLTWHGDDYECDRGGAGCDAIHPLRGRHRGSGAAAAPLIARLAELDLEPGTLEMLMAALTAEVCDHVEADDDTSDR